MRRSIKHAFGIVIALCVLTVLLAVSAFAADLTNIIDLDAEKVDKIYFKGETDKDFTRYEVGEEMTFTFTLWANDEQIAAPFFKYSISGDDGSYSDGYADATSGTVVLKTKLTQPGAVRVVVQVADFAKNVISDIDGKKITTFEGGAIAGALDIQTTLAEPLDFDEFWAEQLELLDTCAPDLFYLEDVSTESSAYYTYIVKVNCIGDPSLVATNATWVAGVLTVPKNADAGSLGFNLTFLGYGVYTAERTYEENYITFAVNSHSIEQLQNGAYYDTAALGLTKYGWKDDENASPYTSYFRWMLLRDVQAVRFLQKYFGSEGGETEFGGIDTGSWKGLWNGEDIRVSGGSQGGFQALSVAALVPEVTLCEAGVPWMADVGSNTVSTRLHTNYRPNYAEGLRYFDSAFMAKRIKGEVIITAGMGDPTCPVYGVQAIYNNLTTDGSIRFRQGQTHGQTSTYPIDFTHAKEATEVSAFGTDAFAIIGNYVDSAFTADFAAAWRKLTARDAVIYSDIDSLSVSSAAVDTKNIILVVNMADYGSAASSVSEEISAFESDMAALGIDNYGIAFVGSGALGIGHQAMLTMAADPDTIVHLLAFGEDSVSAEEIAINLSGSIYDSQPDAVNNFKVIGLDGNESAGFIVTDNINSIAAYPVVTPLYEFKNSGVSVRYETPSETEAEYGLLYLRGAGISKVIKVYDGANVSASGTDAGAEWILRDGVLSISGSADITDTEYEWNSYIAGAREIVISEGARKIGAGAFNVPAGAKVILPYSLEAIDADAFCGNTDFTLAAYEGRIGNTFAEENAIDFENLGVAGTCGTDVYWRYEDGTLYIFGTGDTIVSGVSSYGKTDSAWAEYHSVITKAVVGENITTLGAVAFHNMKKLTTIELTRNVTTVMQGAFETNPALSTIYYKGEEPVVGTADISSITNFAAGYIFDGPTSIERYILSDDLTGTIKSETFKASYKITEMTIPAGVTSVNNLVFSGCSNLNTLTVLGMETTIGTYAFANKTNAPTTNYIGNVTIVAHSGSAAQAFAKTNLMKFRDIESGEEIDYALVGGSVVLEGTMGENINFTIVENSDGETYTLAFAGTGTYIDPEALSSEDAALYSEYAEKITNIVIRAGEEIGDYAFASMDMLESVEIHAGVKSLGKGVFADCSGLSRIFITDTADTAGRANLATITAIGEECFKGTAIETYAMSQTITEIPAGLFKDSALKKAVISKTVTNIGSEAFSGCADLSDITIYAERYTIASDAFDGISASAVISAYEETDGESFAKDNGYTFNSLGVIIHTVEGETTSQWTNIKWVFDEWTGVLTITSTVDSGWNESGKGGWSSIKTAVEEIVIVGNISMISADAFNGMTRLKKVTMSPTVGWIGSNAFGGCTSLTSIAVSGAPYFEGTADFSNIVGDRKNNGLLTTGKNILKDTAITAVILSDAYSDTYPLVDSNLPAGVATIYGNTEYLENYCEAKGLEFIPYGKISNTAYWVIEDGALKVIGTGKVSALSNASSYASDVSEVLIGEGITELSDGAFASLGNLESATFEGNAPAVSEGAAPFGVQSDSFVIYTAKDAEGFEGDAWCGYKLYKTTGIAYGDVNEDGVITTKDVVLLAQYVAEWGVEINEKVSDVDLSGKLDTKDIILIAQYIAGWDVILGDGDGTTGGGSTGGGSTDEDDTPDPDPDTGSFGDIEVESETVFQNKN